MTILATQKTNEDTTASYTIGVDDDSDSLASILVGAGTLDTDLVKSVTVTSPSASKRTITMVPVANAYGTAKLAVTAKDSDGASNTKYFNLVIYAVDDPVYPKSDSYTVTEDKSINGLPLTNDVNPDPNDTLSLVSVGKPSHGSASVTNTSSFKYIPNANYCGSDSFSYGVSDGHKTYSSTVNMTVTCVNDAPTMSAIATQTTNEDTPKTIGFSISDLETAAGNLSLSVTSSNTTLLPVSRINVSGSGTSRTMTVNPAANQNGSTTIKVTVSDGSLTTSRQFVLNVVAQEDVPIVSSIGTQAINEDSTKSVSFTVSDAETAATNLVVSAASSNKTLLPDSNISLGGSGGSRTITVVPAKDQYGSTTVTIKAFDGTTYGSSTFTLNVNPINDVPTISSIGNQSIDEDTAKAVSFTVNDVETAASNLALTATSSNTELLPVANITLSGSGSARSITMAPVGNAHGTSNITLSVSDGNLKTNVSFLLTVVSVNDRPTISGISDITLQSGTESGAIAFSVADVDDSTDSLQVTAVSDNSTLVPNGNIVLSGSGSNRSITLTAPAASQELSGKANITVSVTDGSLTANTHFKLEIQSDSPAWAVKSGRLITGEEVAKANSAISDAVGSLQGHAGVSGGRSNYVIPIAVPPGRSGFTPDVSVQYSSDGGDGIAGVGWSLSAGGSISRCGASTARDGVITASENLGVMLNSNDKLCLSGARLEAVSGSYGASGTQYRTEEDSFSRITQQGGSLGQSGVYFIVETKDNKVLTFGNSANSRIVGDGVSLASSWLISREADASGNNTINYEYQLGTGNAVLSAIYYTGTGSNNGDRVVRFNYENRDDIRSAYLAGGLSIYDQRLSSIQTYVANELVQRYNFFYEASRASQRSLLKEVELCSNDSGCLPATQFTWSDAPVVREVEPVTFYQNGQAIHPYGSGTYLSQIEPRGDINGDGVRDWTGYFVNAEQEVTGTSQRDERPDNCRHSTNGTNCAEGDFNQDGRTDSWNVNSEGQLVLSYTNTDGSQSRAINTGIAIDEGITRNGRVAAVSDYNADGWPDLLLVQYNGGYLKTSIFFHSKNVNAPYSAANSQLVYTATKDAEDRQPKTDVISVGDMDGNGLPDFMQISRKEQITSVLTGSVMLPGFIPRVLKLTKLDANGKVYFEDRTFWDIDVAAAKLHTFFSYFYDANGDGLTDWYYVGASGFQLRLNKGDATFADPISAPRLRTVSYRYAADDAGQEPSDTFYGVAYDGYLIQDDIDNDGLIELLEPSENLIESCGRVYINTGTTNNSGFVCGDELYESTAGSSQGVALSPANYTMDEGVYRYRAIRYTPNASGGTLAPESTDIIGSPFKAVSVDTFGKGLTDLVFSFSVDNPDQNYMGDGNVTGIDKSSYGIYITRNRGSVEPGDTTPYRPSDMLMSVEDGLGNAASWTYKPMSTGTANGVDGGNLYTNTHGYIEGLRDYGQLHFNYASSRYLVSQFSQSNGVGGLNNIFYAYSDAVYNPQGYGNEGFRWIASRDEASGLVTKTWFAQVFPFTSKVLRQATFTADGVLIGNSTTQWAYNEAHFAENFTGSYNSVSVDNSDIGNVAGTVVRVPVNPSASQVFSLYAKTQKSSTYDLQNGAWISDKKSTIDNIDAYGNSLLQTTVQEDSFVAVSATTELTVSPDEANWWLDKVTTTTQHFASVDRKWSGDPYSGSGLDEEVTKTTTVNSWNSTVRLPTSITSSASDTEQTLTTTTSYNTYGLPTSVSQSGQSLNASGNSVSQTRTIKTSYSQDGDSEAADGYFPYQVMDAVGLVTTAETDPRNGKPSLVIDPTGVQTQTRYDALGRLVSQQQTGSLTAYTAYQYADSSAPEDAAYQVVTMQGGVPSTKTYFDKLGRPLRQSVQGMDGNWIFTDKVFDNRGNVLRQTAPYYEGDSAPTQIAFGDYDALNRPGYRQMAQPLGQLMTSNYSYNGLEVDISVEGLAMSRTFNSLGQLMETVDADGYPVRYAYNSLGLPITIEDTLGSLITAKYNGLGQKLWVNDPNQGKTTFSYNSFGELQKQVQANGASQRFYLDANGRLLNAYLTDPDDTLTTRSYSYNSKGQLTKMAVADVYRSYVYDNASRIAAETQYTKGQSFTLQHGYDVAGRPTGMVYPNGLAISWQYSNGYMTALTNAESGYVYRQITALDALGNITQAQLIDGATELQSNFDPVSGVMLSSQAGAVHHLLYDDFDVFGNLTHRQNLATGLAETFSYDRLQRLTGRSLDTTITSLNIGYGYDAAGNLTFKDDYASSYSYNSSRPNAVASIVKLDGSTASFGYDASGNMLSGDGRIIRYDAENKPKSISRNGKTLGFVNGADGQRALQTTLTSSLYYVDKSYEWESDGSWRAYLDDIAVVGKNATDGNYIRFMLKDRLGSAVTTLDHNGSVASRRYFDPFGKAGNEQGTETVISALDGGRLVNRGFTDHEHLDDVALIHMNGRAYDYNLGRFLSVDPFIQSPSNSQSFNPYSYIMNNPLAGTDPTGYASCSASDQLKDCANNLKEGEVNDVVDKDGKKVGHIGKDSSGNIHITSNGSDSGQKAIKSSISLTNTISKITDLSGRGMSARAEGNEDIPVSQDSLKKLASLEQSTLSDDEKNVRSKLSQKFQFSCTRGVANCNSKILIYKKFAERLALTDIGYDMLKKMSFIEVKLQVEGVSEYRPTDVKHNRMIIINMRHSDSSFSPGLHGPVLVENFREFVHESIHAASYHDEWESNWERLTMEKTNFILKQDAIIRGAGFNPRLNYKTGNYEDVK